MPVSSPVPAWRIPRTAPSAPFAQLGRTAQKERHSRVRVEPSVKKAALHSELALQACAAMYVCCAVIRRAHQCNRHAASCYLVHTSRHPCNLQATSVRYQKFDCAVATAAFVLRVPPRRFHVRRDRTAQRQQQKSSATAHCIIAPPSVLMTTPLALGSAPMASSAPTP